MSRSARVVLRDRVIGRIRPEIYGQFLSRRKWVVDEGLHHPGHPLAGPDGIRRDVGVAIEELRPPVIRWPGGCTGTSYDWRDGIGPPASRSRTVDWHFGYDVGNGFGTGEFVDFCRGIDAEPQINLTTGTGSLREALAWVEYCNGTGPSRWADLRRAHGREAPLDVRYWQIGNEEWGDWEIGQLTAAENAGRVREWAKAIRRIDPGLTILGVGALGAEHALDWNLALLRAAWGLIDYLTLHVYWDFDPSADDGDYARVISGPAHTEQAIIALGGLIELTAREKPAGGRPRLAFTEWNCADRSRRQMSPTWRPADSTFRLVDALAVASFLNVLQRNCDLVGLANFAQTINVVGALLVDEQSVIKETVYWPLLMQRRHSGPIAVAVDVHCPEIDCSASDGPVGDGAVSDALSALDVSVTSNQAGDRLWLSVVNRDRSEDSVITVDLGRATIHGGTVTRRLLHHADPLAKNTVTEPEAVVPVTDTVALGPDQTLEVPAHSYVIFEFGLDDASTIPRNEGE